MFASPAAGGATATESTAELGTSANVLQVSSESGNNSTVQHRNPDTVEGESGTDGLRDWLSGRLSERLSESAIQVSEGEYEQADELLGEEYQDLLSKYVDVTGDSGEANTDAERALNETANQQREYANLLAEYRNVTQAYEDAVAEGDELRARELARRLQTLASQIDGVTVDLRRNYQTLSETTGANTENASQSVNETTEEISTEVTTIVEDEFVTTSLSATASNGSFTTGVELSGQLAVTEGDLPESPVTIQIGAQRYQTSLNSAGVFTLDFRPVMLDSGQQSIPISFVPRNDSTLLGAQTTAESRINSTQPAVVNLSTPDQVRFGKPVPVEGKVVVDNRGVEGTPVVLRIGNTTITETTTGRSGTFNATSSLPAGVPGNASTVMVTVGRAGTAITEASSQRPVTVEETATTLSVAATETSRSSVLLEGRLQAGSERPVRYQPIAVTVNGVVVNTVQTNQTGEYRARISPSQLVNGTVTVGASFEGAETNLESATAVTNVSLGVSQLPGFIAEERSPPWWLVGAFGASLVGLGFAIWRYWQYRDDTESTPEETRETTSDQERDSVRDSEVPSGVEERVEEAQAELEGGDSETAIRLAYPALRGLVGEQVSEAQTNWEFYQAVVDDLDGETAGTLRAATEAYEAVVYGDSRPDTGQIEDVIADVRRVMEESNRVAYESGSQTTD